MFRKRRIFGVFLLLLFLLSIPGIAFGSYAYNYGDSNLDHTVFKLYAIQSCWNNLNRSYSTKMGTDYTESNFLADCDSGNAVFANCHGSSGSIARIWDNGCSNNITNTEISGARDDDWKRLVLFDACYSARSAFASAYGISDGDGDNHCYIGWVGTIYDNDNYCSFTGAFFEKVGEQETIADALSYARTKTSITNYYYYGSTSWSY